MQAIAESYAVPVHPAESRQHGKISKISNDGTGCFSGLPKTFSVTRYHSLVADESYITDNSPITVTAHSLNDNYIMALRHKKYNIEGVQFHPESITTEFGSNILKNFLSSVMNTSLNS